MAQNNYWHNRLTQVANRRYKTSTDIMNKSLGKVYKDLSKQMAKEVDDIYFKLLEDDITRTDIWTYKRYRDLSKRMAVLSARVGQQEEEILNKQLEIALKDVYNKTEFPGMSFSTLDDTMVKQLVMRPWSKKHFSQAIWDNKTSMLQSLKKGITESIALGKSKNKAVQTIMNKCAASFNEADRLVRTELMHTINAAQQQKYADNGIKYLEILVGEDERTCPFCSKMAGKKVPIDSKDIPPFHPRCRCTVIPVIDSPKKVNKMSDAEDSLKWPDNGPKLSSSDFKELRKKAESYGIALRGFKNAQCDKILAEELIDSIGRMLNIYPELSVINGKNFTFELEMLNSNDFAETRPSAPHILLFNKQAIKDKEHLEANYNMLRDKGFFVKNTDYHSIVIHEIGHMYDYMHSIKALDIAKQITGIYSKTEILEYIGENLSAYAGAHEKGEEIISEVFSDYYNGDKTEFSLKFINECDKLK